jgi:hypothetical protein
MIGVPDRVHPPLVSTAQIPNSSAGTRESTG